VPRALEQAVQYHRQGRLFDAERFYRDALRESPHDFDTLHFFGVLKLQQGGASDALPLLQKAIEVRPNALDVLSNLSVALLALNRPAEALANFDKILSVAPQDVSALFGRGTVLAQLGRPQEALISIDRALSIQPNHAPALFNRGTILAGLRRYPGALAAYDQVITLAPTHIDALNNRGNVLAQLERYAEAVASFDRVLAIKPDHITALTNRSAALRQLRRYDEALASCDRALALDPNNIDGLNNRGNILLQLNRGSEAISCYQRILSLKDDNPEALVNSAFAFHALGQYPEALQYADNAIAVDPEYANAFLIRGHALAKLDRQDEAAQSYERVLAIEPDHPYARGASIEAYVAACNWERIEAVLPIIEEEAAAAKAIIPPFNLLALPISPARQLECARHFVRRQLPQVTPIGPLKKTRADKIKVAYLSADFRRHPVGYGIVGVLEQHDRARFEVHGVSYGADDGSETRRRIATAVDHFHDVRERSDKEAAALLNDLAVDIVVDLGGHTAGSRMGVLAYRPAPIQVSYFGYAGTSGAEFIDYVMADRVVLPFDQQPFFSERIVHLPDSYLATDADRQAALIAPTRADLELPDNAFIFSCFNNAYKLSRPMVGIWARALKACPNSLLWLYYINESAQANLQQELISHGVDPSRVILAPFVEQPEDHLARLRLADLFLDTLPYNAHTTASDALWAGVPVLTCLGPTFAGRVAGSLLQAVGLPELITNSLEEYETLAQKLASDPALLGSLRERLAQNLTSSPLFDTQRLTRHIEAAYATMRDTWQRGEPPKGFSVEAIAR
jgi:predicted O-linked N-acetylglucosamine transferase (SPINDLY family)